MRPHRRLALYAVIGLVTQGAAAEEGPVASPPARVAPAPHTSVARIESQATVVASRLRRMQEAIADEDEFDALEADVSRASHLAAQYWDDTAQLVDGAPRRAALDSLESRWHALRVDLDRLARELRGRAERRESDFAALTGLTDSWSASREIARRSDAPAPVLEHIEATLAAIAATSEAVTRRRDHVLVLEDTVGRSLEACDDSLARIEKARRMVLRRLVSGRERPLWEAGWGAARSSVDAGEDARLQQQLVAWLAPVPAYVVAYLGGFLIPLLLWPLLGALLRRAGAAGPRASGLLLALMLTIPLRTHAPLAVKQAILVLGLGGALTLLRTLASRRSFEAACGLAALLALDLLRALLWNAPTLEQAAMLVEFSAAAALLLWVGGDLPGPWPGGGEAAPRGWAVGMPRLLAGVCALAAAGAVLGFVEFGDLLGSAAVVLTSLGVAIEAFRRAAARLLEAAAGHVPGPRSRAQRGTRIALDSAALGLWLLVGLDRLDLRDAARDATARLLGATLEVGSLELSLAMVLGFLGTLVAGWLLARGVVFLLDAAVFPRANLPRGVPYALSSLARYAILLAGFLLALTTLGFDLTHLTLIVSAISLGLGFGLQQIVHNFLSGLILLFERPVKVGDALELGDLSGELEHIGIRSSTLRTLDGAEVILPNSTLAEQRVTNWTLSDRRRRFHLDLSVTGNRDPRQVLALLLEVARADPRVASEPAPEALLVRFGDASLDVQLRVWTEEPNWAHVRSDLALALHTALTRRA
jgi:small-conductance mechanosensitive channel